MAITYNNLYLDARRKLRELGVDSAQVEARELLAYAADKSREELLRDMPLYASDYTESRMGELMKRRLDGEPVAYIIGEWEFYGLPLDISPDVLIPRDDTVVLAERGIEAAEQAGEHPRVLDLCAGSGCVGLAIASAVKGSRVTLADLSEGALQVCKQNIRRNGMSAQVVWIKADALEAPIQNLRDFDVITCNPPYIRTAEWETLDVSVRDYEPRMALDGGEDGLMFYRAVASKWGRALKTGGKLIFEVGYDQAPEVEKLFWQNGYTDIGSFQDTAGIWRVVEGTVKD